MFCRTDRSVVASNVTDPAVGLLDDGIVDTLVSAGWIIALHGSTHCQRRVRRFLPNVINAVARGTLPTTSVTNQHQSIIDACVMATHLGVV
jgi:hypothetical protein